MYAIVENGVVTNIIVMNEKSASNFPNAINASRLPVEIGDTYSDGSFWHNGEKVIPLLVRAENIIAELDEAIIELQYQNTLMSLGL